MTIRSQSPEAFARPSRGRSAADLDRELELTRERRRVLELERERQGLADDERRLLETQSRNRRLESLFEDTPYPIAEDGVDYGQVARAKRLFESRELHEAYGAYDYLDIIGPGGWASTWGQPLGSGMQSYLNPLSTRVDRAQGRDRPFVITEVDLGFIRGVARIVCEINCPAKGALRGLVNYTVGGRGFQYTVANKSQKRKAPDGLIEAVQEVVDEFIERVKWSGALGKEGELVRRWFRDGEYFLASHCDRVGRTDLRIIEPEQITEQGAEYWTRESLADYGLDIGAMDLDRTFGSLTPSHDVNSPIGYNAWFDDLGESEFLSAESLQHFKLSDTNIKRGISDFYGAVKWLQRSDSLLTKTAGGAAIQAAIAGIRKHAAGVTKDDVSAFRASKTDYTTTAYMPGGSSRQFTNYSYPDGTILDIGFGLDWVDPPQGADRGPAFVEVAQAMLRWVATQWQMPEFLISSDASNNNYASSLVSEAPFVKNVQGLQFGFGAMWHDLIWRVIYNAARYGRFDRFGEFGSYYSLKKTLKLHLSFPTIETRDRTEETQRLKILSDDGVIALETRASEEGFDLSEEQAKGAKQRPAEITAKADAMDPSGGVAGLAGQDGKGGEPKPHDDHQPGAGPAQKMPGEAQPQQQQQAARTEKKHPTPAADQAAATESSRPVKPEDAESDADLTESDDSQVNRQIVELNGQRLPFEDLYQALLTQGYTIGRIPESAPELQESAPTACRVCDGSGIVDDSLEGHGGTNFVTCDECGGVASDSSTTLTESALESSLSVALYETVEHAPAGGATINGKQFSGGQFIPSADLQKASPKERAQLAAKTREQKSAPDSAIEAPKFKTQFAPVTPTDQKKYQFVLSQAKDGNNPFKKQAAAAASAMEDKFGKHQLLGLSPADHAGNDSIDYSLSQIKDAVPPETLHHFRDTLDQLKGEHPEWHRALRHYQGPAYAALNKALREGKPLDQIQRAVANRLIQAIDHSGEFPEPVETYRGISLTSETAGKLLDQFKACMEGGKTYAEKSFVSQSISPKIANAYMKTGGPNQKKILLKITAKSGLYGNTGESELLQKPGTRYKVTAIDESGAYPVVHVEQVK